MTEITLPDATKTEPRRQVARQTKARVLRNATGIPSWPVLLPAGREKTGKSYHAALASSSDLIDRTFWVGFGEKDPDEYGAIKGSRIEIAEHDNTLADLADTLRYLNTIERLDKPHLLVVDSATKIWETLRDKATFMAERRGSKDKYGDPIVAMDLWNKVGAEWASLLNTMRRHDGPVILTARLDTVAVIENGKPTNAKQEKIQGQKSLAYDVDAIIEMPERGKAELTGARSVIYQLPKRLDYPDFTVDGLWRRLGLATAKTAQPTYKEAAPLDPADPDFRAADVDGGQNGE